MGILNDTTTPAVLLDIFEQHRRNNEPMLGQRSRRSNNGVISLISFLVVGISDHQAVIFQSEIDGCKTKSDKEKIAMNRIKTHEVHNNSSK